MGIPRNLALNKIWGTTGDFKKGKFNWFNGIRKTTEGIEVLYGRRIPEGYNDDPLSQNCGCPAQGESHKTWRVKLSREEAYALYETLFKQTSDTDRKKVMVEHGAETCGN